MRKNFGSKTWLIPQPVMIIATYNEDGTVNAMNAAWGGIFGYDKICVDLGKHKTTDNILRTRAFSVACADSEHLAECDFFGIVSGHDITDKFERTGLTSSKSGFVDAPVINELPVSLECELLGVSDDGRYTGRIVNVSCDERFLGEDGLPDLKRFSPIIFDPVHNFYVALGEVKGTAFSDGNKLR